ncbi:hypothetical protein PLESTB_000105400 [Pleodorina starrii]|uniref:Uncharacterized protein n=1 Tax=Pleodorina starrii TaxID=330485 RepID=A0A9W6BB21_9CHLO|nr:hypothetical protein PLESTM_000101800 [Pleodorina starrii]GLC48505.1 hypothetical protein PLESTB_000105400 [Pleodorina starrii]GLC71824.1 hypothetical protein PLESTF_001171100 [Pleodorina starrii]
MGPLRVPSYLCLERCSSSGQTWTASHRRTAAAQAHGRGRRKSHRYVGVNPSPLTECGTVAPSTSASTFSWPLPDLKARDSTNGPAGSACTSPSAFVRSEAGTAAQSLPSVSVVANFRRGQSDDAALKLLHVLQLSSDDSPVGRLLASCVPSSSTRQAGESAQASAVLGQISRADVVAAAALLPALTWQWLSVADLDGWVDRGVAQLLRETLLVQKAATDASASISELVGWCLDNCSAPATALAALWGQQQAQALPPRSRSFYGLMLQRLGLSEESQPQLLATGIVLATAAAAGGVAGVGGGGGGGGRAAEAATAAAGQRAVVMCGSVARTAVPTSSRRRSPEGLEEADGHEAGTDDEEAEAGPNGSAGRGGGGSSGSGSKKGPAEEGAEPGLGLDPAAESDLVIVGEIPAAARALLEQSAAGEDEAGEEEEAEEEAAAAMQLQSPQPGQARGGRLANGAVGRNGGGSLAGGAAASGTVRGSSAANATRLRGPVGAASDGDGGAGPPVAADAAAEAAAATAAAMAAAAAQGSAGGQDPQPYEGPTAAFPPASALDAAAPSAVTRPTASLLQRPARSPAAAPDPDLDPGAEDGTTAAGSPGYYFQGSAPGPQQAYFAVRLVAVGRFPLRNLSGEALTDGITIPDTGPVVISSDPRVFPGTEAVLSDYSTAAGDKLAMRLEHVVDRSFYDKVVLQLFNISRVKRKRTENSLMYVNGKPVNVGDPGVVLFPGDEVWFGNRNFSFRVEALPGLPSAVQEALQRLCGDGATADDDDATTATTSTAVADGYTSDGGEASWSDEEQASATAAAAAARARFPALSSEPDMAELSNLSRRDPVRAEAVLRRLAAANPGDAAVWLIWAQTAGRMEGPGWQAKTRLLFRAAVEVARGMEVIPPPPSALQIAAQRTVARGRGRLATRGGGGSQGSVSSGGDDDDDDHDRGAAAAAATAEPQRHNWLLVQALGNWGKHEWRLRMYGSARHLFRAAVDEAARHPDGVAGGGGAAILHYWASRELDALNVRNARIVAAEALRKCPADVALYVLAAGVELEGGNLELAKSYCQRAYSLDRTDKQLFLVWPRVEAALGDRLKARLLYERALDMYPLNTKILNLYARFEAEEGSYREAAELYDRALHIDPMSPVMGVHNRADWASLEADLGNTGLARGLLEGGLNAHPRSTPLLVTLAKVERLEGRYMEALQLVRAAQTISGPFNAAVMTERAQVLRALGEREMAANLSRHVAAVKELNRMKQQGYWGSEAWRAYIESTRSAEQQSLVVAARARKLQLGWAPATRGAKPVPTGAAGDGRRPAAPEAQQWMQLEQLRSRRAEARRLEAQRAARVRELEEGGAVAGAGAAGSTSSGDDDYNDYYDEAPVSVPSLDSVRRPMPGDEDVYDA